MGPCRNLLRTGDCLALTSNPAAYSKRHPGVLYSGVPQIYSLTWRTSFCHLDAELPKPVIVSLSRDSTLSEEFPFANPLLLHSWITIAQFRVRYSSRNASISAISNHSLGLLEKVTVSFSAVSYYCMSFSLNKSLRSSRFSSKSTSMTDMPRMVS